MYADKEYFLTETFGNEILAFQDRVIWIDNEPHHYECVIPNFGFDAELLSQINELVFSGSKEHGLVGIQFFAKGGTFSSRYKNISLKNLQKLLKLSCYISSEQDSYLSKLTSIDLENIPNFPRFSDELDIYRNAEIINHNLFFEWFSDEISRKYTVNNNNNIWSRKEIKDRLFSIEKPLRSRLESYDYYGFMKSEKKPAELTLYRVLDDRDDNCGSAPILFVGDNYLIVAYKRWIL